MTDQNIRAILFLYEGWRRWPSGWILWEDRKPTLGPLYRVPSGRPFPLWSAPICLN